MDPVELACFEPIVEEILDSDKETGNDNHNQQRPTMAVQASVPSFSLRSASSINTLLVPAVRHMDEHLDSMLPPTTAAYHGTNLTDAGHLANSFKHTQNIEKSSNIFNIHLTRPHPQASTNTSSARWGMSMFRPGLVAMVEQSTDYSKFLFILAEPTGCFFISLYAGC